MKYVSLGPTGTKVSQICLGSWHLPRSNERDQHGIRKVDMEELRRVVRTAMDGGLNFVDTANRYHGAMTPVDFPHMGNAERVLGEVLGDYERESFVIATKVGARVAPWENGRGLSRKHIFWQIKESLRRLQMDHVDVYIAHVPDPETPHIETIEALNDLVSLGNVHYVGSSNMSPRDIVDFMELANEHKLNGFVTLQEHYNLLEREIESTKAPIARRYGLSIMAYSPLAEGLLSEKYLSGIPEGTRASYSEDLRKNLTESKLEVIRELAGFAKEKGITLPQLAVAWVLSKQSTLGVTLIPIVGVSNTSQLVEDLQCLDISLSDDEARAAEEIARKLSG